MQQEKDEEAQTWLEEVISRAPRSIDRQLKLVKVAQTNLNFRRANQAQKDILNLATDTMHEAGSAAADRDEGAETGVEDDDELQEGGHSKRRRLTGRDERGRPLLPPPAVPEARVSEATATPAGEEGRDDSVEEEARVPRVRPDPEKPTARERLEHNITHCPFRS